jgi:hypothetical protein
MKNFQKQKVKFGNNLTLMLQSFTSMPNMKPPLKKKYLPNFSMTLQPKLKSSFVPITKLKQTLNEEAITSINI